MIDRASKLGQGSGNDFVARIDLEAAADRFRETLQAEAATYGSPLEVFEIVGAIKWFDASKGYGFIVPDSGREDVLLSVDDLRAMDAPLDGLDDDCLSPFADSEWETATVSSFDATRGFGFLSVGSDPSPIYCCIETARRFGYTELKPGQRVQIRWRPGEEGLNVTEMRTVKP